MSLPSDSWETVLFFQDSGCGRQERPLYAAVEDWTALCHRQYQGCAEKEKACHVGGTLLLAPKRIAHPHPFGSVQGTIWLGAVLQGSPSIAHSACPTLAAGVQPTSCGGDVCVWSPQSRGTDRRRAEGVKMLREASKSVLPA
ncbi:Hypothetical predicted protein [Marmota monax]|uniref:Uncharacterized protein n=1 Tax=Marmota monax TaxID=9995 RepID=A0A5E4BQG6_MARMO|nr:hypothetical protein GHT09_003217 [Marmota monax]VTJ70922.1 Hypothetical predicted protein [Marmota monax]